jgi:hypothetical protein
MSQTPGIFNIGSGTFANIPRPSANNLTFFLNANDGNLLYAMHSNGSVTKVPTATPGLNFGPAAVTSITVVDGIITAIS